jgi:hypothetical protein
MSVVRATPSALDVLYALVLESGERWGAAAADFQIADAEAIFSPVGPPFHFLTRPRGGSKTSDTAAICLAWLVAQAGPRQRSYVLAVSESQAAELVDAAAGFVARSPVVGNYVGVEASALYAANGAAVRVLTSGDSTWGKGRDTGFIVLDEFAQWPATRKSRRTWVAMLSATQKTPGLRLVILTSAGEPGHFSYEVLSEARRSNFWHVSEVPGPVPWVSKEYLDAQRRLLTEAEFARLHYNQWTEEDDRLVTEEDLDAACVLPGSLPADRRHRYIITVDLGVKVDATVVVVAHAESIPGEPHAQRVVVDLIKRWVPTRKRQVRLSQVRQFLEETSVAYRRAPVYGDPSQFHEMRQALVAQGVRAMEFKFTSTSVGELASSLVLALRNHQVWLPDRPELRSELLTVRLREVSPGAYRMDHDAGSHDDQAVALGMATHLLLGKSQRNAARFVRAVKEATAKEPPPRLLRPRPPRTPRGRPCQHRWRQDNGHCAWGCGATLND